MSESGELSGHKPHSLEEIDRYIGKEREYIRHYTCNSPREEHLGSFGIIAQGTMFQCKDNTAVVLIPTKLVLSMTGKKELPQNPKEFGLECELTLRKIQEQIKQNKNNPR